MDKLRTVKQRLTAASLCEEFWCTVPGERATVS